MNLRSWALAAAMGAAGCNEYEFQDFTSTDVWHQNPWEKVDILMVVDNSCSMDPYQVKLADDFHGFFDYFVDAGTDWHLAAVTTDAMDPSFGRIRGPVITADAEDPAALFAEVVTVGSTGGGFEMGLEAARRALKGPAATTTNAGFLRDDASLSLIFVSDEEDGSPGSVSEYMDAFYELKGFRARDAFNASALTVTNIEACTPEQYEQSSPGTRYRDIALRTRGVVANLCAEDLTGIVDDLALTTSAMRDTYFLSHAPATGSIEVTLLDVAVPCDAGIWTYAMVDDQGIDRPAIVFDLDNLPPQSARITATYTWGNGDAVDFCLEDSG